MNKISASLILFLSVIQFTSYANSFNRYSNGKKAHPNKNKFSLTPVADEIKVGSKGKWMIDTDHDKIPDEIEKKGYSLYWQIEGRFTWREALDDAISRGGFLATIPDSQANIRVLSAITKKEMCWIGGHDLNKQNQWQWLTGEKWSFTRWGKGEPNNYGGPEDGLVLCFTKDTDYWNDAKTSSRYSYILEKVYKTNPYLADSDGDGFQDLVEIQNGFDPNDSNSRPYKNYILP